VEEIAQRLSVSPDHVRLILRVSGNAGTADDRAS
jgi:hypothetical protein